MIKIYLENVFMITVVITSVIFVIPAFLVLFFRNKGSSLKENPKIKKIAVTTVFILFMAGILIPLIAMILIKISPTFIDNMAPLSIYFIIIFICSFIFANIKRLRKIEEKKSYIKENRLDKASNIEEEISTYESRMIVLVIFICYFAILFSLRVT